MCRLLWDNLETSFLSFRNAAGRDDSGSRQIDVTVAGDKRDGGDDDGGGGGGGMLPSSRCGCCWMAS
jgi:hypothetical protein